MKNDKKRLFLNLKNLTEEEFNFSSCFNFHKYKDNSIIYKAYGQMSSEQRGIGIPHTTKVMCILATFL